jgi:hypothetical protein
LVLLPLIQEASQKSAFFPFLTVTFVAAAKKSTFSGVQGVPRLAQVFASSFHSCHSHLFRRAEAKFVRFRIPRLPQSFGLHTNFQLTLHLKLDYKMPWFTKCDDATALSSWCHVQEFDRLLVQEWKRIFVPGVDLRYMCSIYCWHHHELVVAVWLKCFYKFCQFCFFSLSMDWDKKKWMPLR